MNALPDPERIRVLDLDDVDIEKLVALRKALLVLKGYTRQQLISIRRAIQNWDWHPLLGPEPEGWADMIHFRRTYMPKDTRARADYLLPYSGLLRELGVTAEDAEQ